MSHKRKNIDESFTEEEEEEYDEGVVEGFKVLDAQFEENRARFVTSVIALWKGRPRAKWRPFVRHDCQMEECNLVEIVYHVVNRAPFLGPGPKEFGHALLYGCESSGVVHRCGPSDCSYASAAAECPLTGMGLNQEYRHSMWSPYATENTRMGTWRLGPGYQTRVPLSRIQSWDDFAFKINATQAEDLLADLVKSRCSDGKIEAYGIAYFICLMLFSQERFVADLEDNEKGTIAMDVDLKRYATKQEQRGRPVSMQAMDRIAANHILTKKKTHQILFLDEKNLKALAEYYATKCIALWIVLRSKPPEPLPIMSFRNFVIAALRFFSEGYTITNGLGYLAKPIPQDALLKTFPVSAWLTRKVYPKKKEKKIHDGLRKAEETMRKVICDAIVRDGLSPEELRCDNLQKEDADAFYFVKLRK